MIVIKNLTNQIFTINTTKYSTLQPHQTIEIDVMEYSRNKTLKGLERNGNIMVYQKQQVAQPSKSSTREIESVTHTDTPTETPTPKKRGRRKKNT